MTTDTSTTAIAAATVADRTGELMATAFNVAEKKIRPEIIHVTDPRDGATAPFIVSGKGVEPLYGVHFDDFRANPLFREGTAVLTQLPSFIALTNRFKDINSAIFAVDDLEKPSLTAIFDYHPANIDEFGVVAHERARHRRHKATYAYPLSKEWQAWFSKDCKAMTMGDFAAFLETHIVDVSEDPVSAWSEQAQAFAKSNRATTESAIASPTRLVDLSLKFRIYETAESCEAVNLTTGETQFAFVSEHKQADGKPVDFPKLFSIVIPIFARSTVFYRIIARLRYRLQSGKPVFWFELWRPDLTFEQAFNETLEQVAAETGLPIYAGTAEEPAADADHDRRPF
ncbi:DUF2303 family protein [Novosphingobium guangzhouense]|uniref:DUF2303 domain-containing protein n=1 Tax=Novosphingobium guangzhouense TaxID=1850347 RepID=A0A2K2FYS0_9SPHN|nr:DUF2303 family protein [Novosphingobium guangzhouense]PNU03945.1 hypothetical protein A8V01_04810 [Novosphingobium guangzhouense]